MTEKTTGFASPAQGYEEQTIDLNRLLIRNPPATIYVRLDSSDMEALGLVRDTLLVIDRSITPTANALVMLWHEGRFLCRLLVKKRGKTSFTDGRDEIYPIEDETEIIGTVTAAIRIYSNDISHYSYPFVSFVPSCLCVKSSFLLFKSFFFWN